MTYEWKFNGDIIAGATASTYTLASVQAGDAGNYTVELSNQAGSATSSIATLTVIPLPVIVTQPVSRTNVVGTSASFSVAVTGTALAYQWQFNGANISGVHQLQLHHCQRAIGQRRQLHRHRHQCPRGRVTSAIANLTVIVPPTITTQPVSRTNVVGTSASFSVAATGTGLAYQWQFNGANIAGATGRALTRMANAQSANAGSYTVTVTNSRGSSDECDCQSVRDRPADHHDPARQPDDVVGTSASFSVAATGTALAYQWRFNGANIAGATASTYTLANAQTNNAGSYTVVITNLAGQVTSAIASLTRDRPADHYNPARQPDECGRNFGELQRGRHVEHHWLISGSSTARTSSGANGEHLHAGQRADQQRRELHRGDHQPRGQVTSAIASLTVIVPPTITTQPVSRTNVVGTSASFSVAATGTALAYQWRFNGANIAGATASTYTLASAQTNNAGSYTVVITNLAGQVTSAIASLTVIAPPTFTWSAPVPITTADQTLNLTGNIVGAAMAGGTDTFVTLSNGTSILFKADGSVAYATGANGSLLPTTDGFFAQSTTGNANFNSVLNRAGYDSGPHTIVIRGLTTGQQYAVQLFALDDRGGLVGARTSNFQVPAKCGQCFRHFCHEQQSLRGRNFHCHEHEHGHPTEPAHFKQRRDQRREH